MILVQSYKERFSFCKVTYMTFLWNWVFTLVQVIGKADTWFLTTFLSWRPKSQIHSHMSEGHKRAFFPRKTILTVNRRANHGCRGRVKSSALLFNNVWAITETTRKEMPLYLNSLQLFDSLQCPTTFQNYIITAFISDILLSYDRSLLIWF